MVKFLFWMTGRTERALSQTIFFSDKKGLYLWCVELETTQGGIGHKGYY